MCEEEFRSQEQELQQQQLEENGIIARGTPPPPPLQSLSSSLGSGHHQHSNHDSWRCCQVIYKCMGDINLYRPIFTRLVCGKVPGADVRYYHIRLFIIMPFGV